MGVAWIVCPGGFFCMRDAREACAACRRGFVGGWLLGRRESAKCVFQKSELASLKQRTFEKQRRFPPAKNQHPSCRVRRQAAHASRAGFSGWGVMVEGWVAAREIGFRMIGGVGSRRLDEPSALRWTARWKG